MRRVIIILGGTIMKYIILFLMSVISNTSYADSVGLGADRIIPAKGIIKAIMFAANKYGVDANDLVRIAYLESRMKPKAMRYNTNGTVDTGLFQINSVHWSTTCKSMDILTVKGNALCAAKLLSEASQHKHTDAAWRGRYHSKTPRLKYKYANMIALVDIN